MISLTVGLPLYKSRDIVWLAMESLCRQSSIWFNWELIVCEEDSSCNSEFFGEEELMKYSEKLKAVGCESIKYISVDKWIPLSQKWKQIAEDASETSLVFVLQAADCYSPARRLVKTYELIKSGHDWVQGDAHNIYDLLSDKMYLLKKKTEHIGSDMAVRTSLAKQLPFSDKKRGVDTWFFLSCKAVKKNLSVGYDRINVKFSLNVHGLNNISNRRKMFGKTYKKVESRLENIVPKDIADRLRELKPLADMGRTFI